MPTPDRFPGVREEEEISFSEDTVDPVTTGNMKYVNGDFRMKDDTGVFNPRGGFDVDTIVVSDGDVVTSGGCVVVSGS